ncbi:DUF1906 domain-containing protein [Streptomyces sp. H10-C2]|uniref:DUF1906 domain-containing protein n=1 Tax=unclassified Streptomyces TaxID=2593676 RepID=UPI0024B9A96C|nr:MULTISPECIES: DUF1906 domain-containing protein [unclassified Streptomyces]MDJ0342098.1 DUF1906 domain-containing protein [Streptomyces sp. PH10-H1]MDJ0368440.1 DUF1906 domain-containing protein [Streptomyces sp. H10-C2]
MRENNRITRYAVMVLAAAVCLINGGLAQANGGIAQAAPVPDPPAVNASASQSAASQGATSQGATSALVTEAALRGTQTFQGLGFDTCMTPSATTMRAWHGTSPYSAVGVYFGGRARACPVQPNLTPAWAKTVSDMGWSLLPIYVGSQSPCVMSAKKAAYTINPLDPEKDGVNEARDAAQRAHDLGLAARSALYLDMEAYDIRTAACTAPTLAFVQAWDREVRRLDYVPGFYSSADSGIEHMEQARTAGAPDLPSVLWYARWNAQPTLTAEPALPDSAWQPHSRIHQYEGNVTEHYGGESLTIDRDILDAPVGIVG